MSETAPPLDLRPDHWTIVSYILRQHVPDREVLAFGSRATWTAKNYSDLDLAILGDKPLSLNVSSALAEAFGESDLPFKVDLVDWARVDDRFREIIRRSGVPVQNPARDDKSLSVTDTLRLGEHCEKIGSGATPRGGKGTYSEDGPIALIRSQNVHNDRFSHSGLARISVEQAAKLQNVEVRPGDVLLNITGDSVARTCQVDNAVLPARVNQHVAIIRPKPRKIDPKFLRCFLVSPSMQLHMLGLAAAGATRNALTKSMIEELRIPAWSIHAQRSIAAILEALDDKIELNRRINETLEAMARAIFKDWFVDFGPTRAMAEGRAPYLAPELWDLFPDALDEEGKPCGWLVRPASDLFEFNPRETVKKGTNTPYLDMAALPTIGAVPDAPINREYKSGSKFRDGDTLFARITPCLENGKTAYVFGLGADVLGAGSTEFIVIRSRAPLPKPASYILARDPGFRAHAERSMTGTSGRQRASKEALSQHELTTPPDDLLWKALRDLANPMMDRVIANAYESRILAHTRDLLLPKLMSGEIRLSEAEMTVEAIA